MNLVELKCPNCNGKLHINPELEKIMCNFCGSEFINESGQMTTIRITKNINTNINKTTSDIKIKENKTTSSIIKWLVILIIAIFIMFFGSYMVFRITYLMEKKAKIEQEYENESSEVILWQNI